MKKHKLFSTLLNNQQNALELVLLSVVVALCINLVATSLINILDFPQKDLILLIVGFLVSILIIIQIIYKKLKSLNQSIEIEGFFIFNEKDKSIIKVPEYGISEDMVRYLDFAFSENKALATLWRKDKLSQIRFKDGKPGKRAVFVLGESGNILIELLEYCIIQKLSVNLSDFFNNKYDRPNKHELKKTDIPDILLQNRFLKLFSEDMNNREAFVCFDTPQKDGEEVNGTIVAACSSGALYEKFNLILPNNCNIIRKSKNELVIETPILRMVFSYHFGGFSTVLPSGFHKYYLGIDYSPDLLSDYKFNIDVSIEFKFKSLFSTETQIYYAWIDSFLDSLSSYICENDFFEKINWATAYTIIQCSKNINKTLSFSTDNYIK